MFIKKKKYNKILKMQTETDFFVKFILKEKVRTIL